MRITTGKPTGLFTGKKVKINPSEEQLARAKNFTESCEKCEIIDAEYCLCARHYAEL